MPIARCHFCTLPPKEDVAVLRWAGEDRDRTTVPVCVRHHAKLAKAGERGWEHRGYRYKLGWW